MAVSLQGLIQDLNLGGSRWDQFQGYKDCPNYLYLGGEENLLFLDALKHSIL